MWLKYLFFKIVNYFDWCMVLKYFIIVVLMELFCEWFKVYVIGILFFIVIVMVKLG